VALLHLAMMDFSLVIFGQAFLLERLDTSV
jgi:hypothetical protein